MLNLSFVVHLCARIKKAGENPAKTKNKEEKMKRYANIDYLALHKSGLSILEWLLLDLIYFFSNNKYRACYASRETLAKNLGVSKRHIYRLIESITKKGFCGKTEARHLVVTEKYINLITYQDDTFNEPQTLQNDTYQQDDNMSQEMTKCHSESDKMSLEDDKMSLWGVTKCHSESDKMSPKDRYISKNIIKKDKEVRNISRESQFENCEAQRNNEEVFAFIEEDKGDTYKEAEEVANYLADKILAFKPNARIKPKKWIADIEKAIRIDKRSKEELLNVIDWIYNSKEGNFWIPNIMSGKKLREKFDTLEAQMFRSDWKKQSTLSAIEEFLKGGDNGQTSLF